MAQLKVDCFTVGDLAVNSYLVFNPDSKQALIIDAPEGVEKVLEFIERHNLDLRAVLITHGHIDHINGLNEIKAPVYMHELEKDFLHDKNLNMSPLLGRSFKTECRPCLIKEGDLEVNSFKVKVLHTPGHTPGSVSYVIGDWIFSGDALFFGSIGRTDMSYGCGETLVTAIRKKIIPLGEDKKVFPGHGPATTVKRELQNNPFI
jgi:glyoxylase-like metal-dependent hydrolase (beta-lactamase superfamily II)